MEINGDKELLVSGSVLTQLYISYI